MTTERLRQALDDLAAEADSYARVDTVLAVTERRRRWRTVTMAVVAVLVVALGGGAFAAIASPGAQSPPITPAATGAVHRRWTSCAVDAGLSAGSDGLPRLGEDFSPVAVTVCRQELRRRADGGTDLVLVELRGDDVAGLVAALRLPDLLPPSADQVVCDLAKVSVPWFALLDADGRWVRPEPPVGACGKPRTEVMDAVNALRLHPVSTTFVREIESAEAVAAGCTEHWGDMVAVETYAGGRAAAGHGRDTLPPEVRLCVYRVPAGEQGTAKPAGTFEHGGLLPAQRRAEIGRALAAALPASDCAKHASRFAILMPIGTNNGEVYVELDGCRRILVPSADARSYLLAQGGDALTQLIDQS